MTASEEVTVNQLSGFGEGKKKNPRGRGRPKGSENDVRKVMNTTGQACISIPKSILRIWDLIQDFNNSELYTFPLEVHWLQREIRIRFPEPKSPKQPEDGDSQCYGEQHVAQSNRLNRKNQG